MSEDVTPPKTNATVSLKGIDVFVDLKDFIDVEAEQKRLEKEHGRIEGMITGKEKKLSNESFTSRAPAEIVERERATLIDLKKQLETIQSALGELKS